MLGRCIPFMQRCRRLDRTAGPTSSVSSNHLHGLRARFASAQATFTEIFLAQKFSNSHGYMYSDSNYSEELRKNNGKESSSPPHGPPSRGHPPARIVSRSEEHTSELQSLMRISYAVFCLKKKK